VGRNYKKLGPIEPGNYRINRDTRVGGEERFRLKPSFRVGCQESLRSSFLMEIGDSRPHGCIQILKGRAKTHTEFKKLQQVLEAWPNATNKLLVVQ